MPPLIVISFVILKVPPSVTPAVLLMVKSFIVLVAKVLAGIVCADAPFNSIVPEVAVNVPLLLMVPPIFRVAPVTVNVAPDCIVILFAIAVIPPLMIG